MKMTLLLLVMVITVQGASFNALMKKGNKFLSKKDYENAEQCFVQALSEKPDSAAALYRLGYAQYQQKEYKEALENFNRAWDNGSNESDRFKANCKVGISNCWNREAENQYKHSKEYEEKKDIRNAYDKVIEAKKACQNGINNYEEALSYSRRFKNSRKNLRQAKRYLKELEAKERELKKQLPKEDKPQQNGQQQQGDQKQDGEKQDGQQQQQDGQQQQQDGQKQDGEHQQQGEQQQKDVGKQLKELAKRQSQEAEKNEQGQQSQQQAADEQKKLSDETEQIRQEMEQHREEEDKQNGKSSEKSDVEKKLDEARKAQKKAEDALEKEDMKSASEA
ncbi:MAG: tetratricopeptide repeat protein, partial [Victivallales bacterium]|nr:tetratricopeptide repeat protein [Victivallales bacterium]